MLRLDPNAWRRGRRRYLDRPGRSISRRGVGGRRRPRRASWCGILGRDALPRRSLLALCPLTPGLERGVSILDQLFVERRIICESSLIGGRRLFWLPELRFEIAVPTDLHQSVFHADGWFRGNQRRRLRSKMIQMRGPDQGPGSRLGIPRFGLMGVGQISRPRRGKTRPSRINVTRRPVRREIRDEPPGRRSPLCES